MKKHLIVLMLLLWQSAAHGGGSGVNPVDDSGLNFVLNNFSLLLERDDPDVFPGKLRLVELPDQFDDCSWAAEVKNITSAELEDWCPIKNLYVTLSNWDLQPEQFSYRIGSAIAWSVIGLEVDRRKSQSFWRATLKLEAFRLVDGKKEHQLVDVVINNKNDVYTVSLGNHE